MPLTMDDVTVTPGDVAVGDADGVVVLPHGDLDQVYGASAERVGKEQPRPEHTVELEAGECLLGETVAPGAA